MNPSVPALTIHSTRVLPYSREQVFGAFADPTLLARWWGPEGFSNTIHEFELRPGGPYRLTMHGPNGAEYQSMNQFIQVTPPELIVLDHFQTGHDFRMTMRYEELALKQCRLSWTQEFAEDPNDDGFKDFIEHANEQNLQRLEKILHELEPKPGTERR